MRKYFLLLIGFILLINHNAFPQWTTLNSGTDRALSDLKVFNKDTVVIVGDSGTVLKTVDGGLTWNQYSANTNISLKRVDFLNDSVGIAISKNGLMIKTIDGGISWNPIQNLVGVYYFNDLIITSDSTIVVVGNFINGNILKSFDFGANWIVDSLPSWNISSIDLINDSSWFVADQNANIFRTNNKGSNWMQLNVGSGWANIEDLDIVNDTLVFGFGVAPNCTDCFFRSVDGGNSWFSTLQRAMFLAFLNNGVGYSSNFQLMEKTINFGNNFFVERVMGLDTIMTAIKFADQNIGYRVGTHGTIFKTLNGSSVGINEIDFNYQMVIFTPNPSSSFTTISAPSFLNSTLSLYDLTGRILIQQKFNEQATINVSALKAGMYVVEARDEKGMSAKGKLIKN